MAIRALPVVSKTNDVSKVHELDVWSQRANGSRNVHASRGESALCATPQARPPGHVYTRTCAHDRTQWLWEQAYLAEAHPVGRAFHQIHHLLDRLNAVQDLGATSQDRNGRII